MGKLTDSVSARAPITYDVLGGGTTHAPLVFASVGGAPPARFVLDTGSEVHLLNEDLADELKPHKAAGRGGDRPLRGDDAQLERRRRRADLWRRQPSVARRGLDARPATLIDTGGKRTEFAAAAVPGLVGGQSERLGGGVSGADVHGVVVGRQTLVVGGRRLAVPALGVRETMHDPQGLIGMDVLRGTIVACAADVARPVFWLVPAGPVAD